MPGKVFVFVESVPEGKPVVLPAFGTIPNGSEKEVTDNQIATFKAQGYEWPDEGVLNIIIPPVGDSTKDPVDPEVEGDN